MKSRNLNNARDGSPAAIPTTRSPKQPQIWLPTLTLVAFQVALVQIYYGSHIFLPTSRNTQMESSPSSLPAPPPVLSSSSFQLAYDQSFGFFDDISDTNWKHAQSIHARLFPNHYNLQKHSNLASDMGNYEVLDKSKSWNGANFQEEFHCALSQRIPSTSDPDGPKWVCDPHRLRHVPDCLVYSVGSNGNVMFEKGIHEEIGPNCEIHTFDMVKYNRRNGNFEKALSGYSTFHAWGLGTEKQAATYNTTKRGSPMKTLQQTMEELGHVGRRIDIFKIDCEWCEWFTYQQWLADGVDLRQILVETHNAPMPEAQNFFFDLHDHGYVIFNKEANYMSSGSGVEFAFLKLRKDFFINNTMYHNQAPQPEQLKTE